MDELPRPSALRSQVTRRNALRALFATAIVLTLVGATASGGHGAASEVVDYEVGEKVAPPRDGMTVFTNSQHGRNYLTAIAPNGTVVYNGHYLDINNDVDPSPKGKYTVLVVGARVVSGDACSSADGCHVNTLMRVNLTTGERNVLWTRTTDIQQNQIHDVDRLGPHRFLVGDISHDRVFVINTKTGMETWSWHAQSAYNLTSGGVFPGDWTHLNDVEVLQDGRYMVNLRNQDQVVFIDPQTGLQRNWTLGVDDDHSILFEQHNPDYIPAENGGPAILVSDSENNRIVEYQRVNGTWKQTWVWQDARMQWPRDADRLPNGHTLIADSNGRRVFEVNRQGEVVWSIRANGVYDVERLGTGDESTGGPSARKANLQSVGAGISTGPRDTTKELGPVDRALLWLKEQFPASALNGILYVAPDWFNFRELVGSLLLVLLGLAWATAEWRWSPYAFALVRTDRDPGTTEGPEPDEDATTTQDD